MALFDKELNTTRCGYDWLAPALSTVDMTAANMHPRMLNRQTVSSTKQAPRLQKINRPAFGSRLDQAAAAAALLNYSDNSPYAKTSDTDSGTASAIATEHFSQPHVNKQKSLYKTELCRSWEEKGRCPYGNKCQYAHGTDELRPVARHPKFKTEVCCTFVTTGTCPYGRRCRFIHKNVPITAVGKQVGGGSSKKNDSFISSANSITATSRRLPIFVKLARGEEIDRLLSTLSIYH